MTGGAMNGNGELDVRLALALGAPERAAAELSDLLTEGYAHAHDLEIRALRLERRSAALAGRAGRGEELSSVMDERRRVMLELVRLRGRLSRLRTAARSNAAR
jgi:hypothetical protein